MWKKKIKYFEKGQNSLSIPINVGSTGKTFLCPAPIRPPTKTYWLQLLYNNYLIEFLESESPIKYEVFTYTSVSESKRYTYIYDDKGASLQQTYTNPPGNIVGGAYLYGFIASNHDIISYDNSIRFVKNWMPSWQEMITYEKGAEWKKEFRSWAKS